MTTPRRTPRPLLLTLLAALALLAALLTLAACTSDEPITAPTLTTTIVTTYTPAALPTELTAGSCWTRAIAAPWRDDGWRCRAGEVFIHDPCFEVAGVDHSVVCDIDPGERPGFTLQVIGLPVNAPTPTARDASSAWFVELEDGTRCSRITGSTGAIESQLATYACQTGSSDAQAFLLSELNPGPIWTSTLAILSSDPDVDPVLKAVALRQVWQ